jgi:hypothetical protein
VRVRVRVREETYHNQRLLMVNFLMNHRREEAESGEGGDGMGQAPPSPGCICTVRDLL